ncbi:MAG TPA: hypothetical protein VMI73_11695 [Trebonia sp.]|nr:hypothetical protein [Trebonia sp.]
MLNENSEPNGALGWDDARLADETAAAMRDMARTVTDAPPLRLETAPDELGFPGFRPSRPRWLGRRLRTWIVPAAAAVTVAAVAIALVLVRNIPNGRVPSPAASPTSTTAVNPTEAGGVPEYYVAYMQADRPYLLVQNTLTGKQYGYVPSPPGVYLNAVYGGSADNRTWLVQGTHLQSPQITEWYVLTIAPGTENPLEMGSAGIPVRESPAGAALSPDGKEVAVAVNGSPATLRVYSLRTGALLHTWTASSGKFAAYSLNLSDERSELALRWSPDGRKLDFVWNAKAIRAIDVTAADGNLLGPSKVLAAIGVTYTTGADFTCKAWQGWEPISVARGPSAGQGVICGGAALETMLRSVPGSASPAASSTASHAACQDSIGFLEATTNSQDGSSYLGLTTGETDCPAGADTSDGAYIGWSNADGSILIGSLVLDGHARFGIFRHDRFTALPALPGAGALVPVGVLYGADVW